MSGNDLKASVFDSDVLSAIRAIKGTNPGFITNDTGYKENCQRSVIAYEARRRGYDVIAKPISLNKCDSLPYTSSSEGWPAAYENYKLEYCSADTAEHAKQKVEALMKSYGDKSRAIVKVDWLCRNKGHLFIAENRKGVIYFVDPQMGCLDASWYFDFIDPMSVVLLRTDILAFTKLSEKCFEVER